MLCSDAGSGKTAVLKGTARTLAIRYQEERPYYLSCGTVSGLRSAHGKGLLKQGVPRVIEDYAPRARNRRSKRVGQYESHMTIWERSSVEQEVALPLTHTPEHALVLVPFQSRY